MKCSIKRIDLLADGQIIGPDLPVDWSVEVSDESSGTNGRQRLLRFTGAHLGRDYPVSVEPASSKTFEAIKTGFRLTNKMGQDMAVLKTDIFLV